MTYTRNRKIFMFGVMTAMLLAVGFMQSWSLARVAPPRVGLCILVHSRWLYSLASLA